jgi:hypothetical protein
VPENLTPKLPPVATEYLRNHDELEAARNLFLAERAKLLDHFGAVMLNAAGQLQQTVTSSHLDDTYGLFDVDISAAYVTTRAKANKKKYSGYSVGLGSFLGHVGAQTLLWFEMKVTPSRKAQLELAALEKTLGGASEIFLDKSSWLYIRTTAQSAADLDLEALSDEARRLPELFETADSWIAKRWTD